MIATTPFSRASRPMALKSLCLAALLGVAMVPAPGHAETGLSALIERFNGAAEAP